MKSTGGTVLPIWAHYHTEGAGYPYGIYQCEHVIPIPTPIPITNIPFENKMNTIFFYVVLDHIEPNAFLLVMNKLAVAAYSM